MDEGRISQLFASIDAMNADAFVSFLTPDAVFRFGTSAPVVGQGPIHTLVAGFWQSIAGSSHRLLKVWKDGDDLAIRGEVTYTRKDGRKVEVPFVNVFKLKGDRVSEYLIHIDNGPLFAA